MWCTVCLKYLSLPKLDNFYHCPWAQFFPLLPMFGSSSLLVMCAGGRTAAEIVNWLKKRTGPPAKELTTVEDARAFTKKDDVVVVGFFKDGGSDAANAFISAADTQDSVTFGITSVKEVADALDATFDSIILFKQVGVCGCVRMCRCGGVGCIVCL